MTLIQYQKLPATEKRIYSELKTAIENLRFTVTFYGVSNSTVSRALEALLDDCPEFFWVSGAVKYEWHTQGSAILDITCKLETYDNIGPDEIKLMQAKFNATVRDIVVRARQYKTHFQRILYVHDYIVDTTDYLLGAPMQFNAYGCLVNHRAVCAGYAKAFQVIMNILGYECGFVRGSDLDGSSIHSKHAWNYIKIENDYYFIDLTWDDPKVEKYSANTLNSNKTRHYFCISEQELSLTHRIFKKYDCPSCKGTKYNYYVYKNYFLTTYSFSAVRRIAMEQLRVRKKFSVKFACAQEVARAEADLIENQKVYDIPGVTDKIAYSISKSGLILTVENRL